MPVRATPVLAASLVAVGVLLPLFGLSLLAVLVQDQLVLRGAAVGLVVRGHLSPRRPVE
jgi:uncharacterized iron-regulated membrane protein